MKETVVIKTKSPDEYGKSITIACVCANGTERDKMLEQNEKPQENRYRVVVAQTRSDGQDTVWETQKIVATAFGIDDCGNLLFWNASNLIAAVSPGNWQRIDRIE